jgi:hypothetical protein
MGREPLSDEQAGVWRLGLAAFAVTALMAGAIILYQRAGLPLFRAQWSHRDLLDYLARQGVALERALWKSYLPEHPRVPGGVVMIVGREVHGFGRRPARIETVRIEQCPTAEIARDLAANHGSDGFAWGRFYFEGDKELVARIRAALGA